MLTLMQYFVLPMNKVDLPAVTEYQSKQCELFTDYVFSTNEKTYKSRGSSSSDKIKKDIYQGKVAECMVWNYLEMEGRKPTPIDFTIYEKKRKSFDADICVEDFKIHVKSCADWTEYPNSWLFQKQDPLIVDATEKDMLFLCVLTDDRDDYAYVVPAQEAEKEEPIAFPLKRSKVAVYESTINVSTT